MKEKIKTLQELLDKGYKHYFEFSDGCHKASEAYIGLNISWPNYFEHDGEYVGSDPDHFVITIYSYVLGPYRTHEFEGKTFDEAYQKALSAVTEWVDKELETTYEDQ